MGRKSKFWTMVRGAGLPAVAIVTMGFFGYNAVFGPNGVIALKDVKQEVAVRTAEYQTLDKQRAVLKNRVDLLAQAKGADPDLVEELIRKQLNAARPDEVIVKYK
ncbi:septum formation initiator family protein [Sphingomonas sp. AOB5]|uniref:FtsB family cell division protein n=1 Tax=Sphingomonas sp. AOB5 TaxID=3034017 RepID=UPI0023F8471F|nr:septum formation initiator family protein [Sphingomonas sp. AOB5]MDF7774520.1 septum formation initiator family protein [Sphingomonas sp. AOB5]